MLEQTLRHNNLSLWLDAALADGFTFGARRTLSPAHKKASTLTSTDTWDLVDSRDLPVMLNVELGSEFREPQRPRLQWLWGSLSHRSDLLTTKQIGLCHK